MPEKTNGIAEILAARQFPQVSMQVFGKKSRKLLDTSPTLQTKGCSRKEWVSENLAHDPVRVTGPEHFKELQKQANCVHIGDDGQAEVTERIMDRSADIKRRKRLGEKPDQKKPRARSERQKSLDKWWDEKGIDKEEKAKYGIT